MAGTAESAPCCILATAQAASSFSAHHVSPEADVWRKAPINILKTLTHLNKNSILEHSVFIQNSLYSYLLNVYYAIL